MILSQKLRAGQILLSMLILVEFAQGTYLSHLLIGPGLVRNLNVVESYTICTTIFGGGWLVIYSCTYTEL